MTDRFRTPIPSWFRDWSGEKKLTILAVHFLSKSGDDKWVSCYSNVALANFEYSNNSGGLDKFICYVNEPSMLVPKTFKVESSFTDIEFWFKKHDIQMIESDDIESIKIEMKLASY